jgi:hypothetical protein
MPSEEPVERVATTIQRFVDRGESVTRTHETYPAAIQWARRHSKDPGVDLIEVRLDDDLRWVYGAGRVLLRRGR